MIRKLPSLSLVLSADSKTHPWKVERREMRYEHLTPGPNSLRYRESFIIVHVGRYPTEEAAVAAAERSAKRTGGRYRDCWGIERLPIGAEVRP